MQVYWRCSGHHSGLTHKTKPARGCGAGELNEATAKPNKPLLAQGVASFQLFIIGIRIP